MALAEILAVADTNFSSGDVTVDAGTPLTVCLKDAVGPNVATNASVLIELKADDGVYIAVDELTGSDPARVISGAGTYRFTRRAPASCGLFRAA